MANSNLNWKGFCISGPWSPWFIFKKYHIYKISLFLFVNVLLVFYIYKYIIIRNTFKNIYLLVLHLSSSGAGYKISVVRAPKNGTSQCVLCQGTLPSACVPLSNHRIQALRHANTPLTVIFISTMTAQFTSVRLYEW